MYKKSVQGWLKHLDFMILDVVCLWISFTLAFNMRHGSLDVLANSLYRDMMWSLALMDIVVIFFFDSLKNVLKRGFYQEFVMTVKQTCLITLCSVFYLFTFKEAENYSRLVLGYTAALYLLISYVLRCLWKNCLRKYFGGAEKRSLLIVTISDIVDTVIDNIKNKNYGDYFVTGVCILDKKAKGRVIDGVTVVADEDDLVEYVCREWVDEVFINIPESEPYPAELLDKFIEMGVVVHMKLAKSQNLLGKKQFVEHLGTYTVLTTSINSVSRRQIILKRMMDIAGGLAGCIITGILCIFVGPAIYIQSPGPIFFKQTRVGKNGKMFQMYKFRSMYMDAEERKAELMKENRVQDGMMFKLDFDPRIIGSKKLPDGTIKKGVGNFIRDWSLDEFPQFLNVLKGDMSLVGTRPPTVDEWDKYELHHRARLATKPGLTGMWQVSGRSNITDLRSLADELNISLLKLRKLLITADVFTSDICTEINDLYQSGKKIPEIMKLTGLSRASVHSYLPYTKGLYNAAEISLNAERCRTYKNRQEQVRLLQEIPSEENLWQAVIAFQDYPFKTATGLPFRYKLKVGKNGEYNRELLIDRREKSKSLAWSSVVLAFENSKRISEEVKKPKALGDIRGVSYIYSILWRFGLIRVPEAIEKNMGKQR